MSEALPSFQQYQQAFTAYVRNPQVNKPPRGTSAKRMKVYAEIVFNNFFSSVSACFPVSQTVLGKRAWQKLVRAFFTDYQSNTPIFREIPEQFLAYINTRTDLPAYLPELAHYEWIELAVSMRALPKQGFNEYGNLLEAKVVMNPTLALLSYNYPVHMISSRFKTRQRLASPVYLLVYLNQNDAVKFIEINALTWRLLNALKDSASSGQQVLTRIAQEIDYADSEAFIKFGFSVLEDLKRQHVILGTAY